MQAIIVRGPGGPEVLEPVDLAEPSPGPQEAVIAVAAAGVNFVDTYQRSGYYPREYPFVPGLEGAGIVTAVGSAVAGLAVGDRVAWSSGPGSYAALVAVPAVAVVPVPDVIALDIAAAVMLQGLTCHYLLDGAASPRPGDTVLIHAGAGGVGQLFLQMARRRGVRTITTVSTPEKEAMARAAGADVVVRYDVQDVRSAVMEATDGLGVHVAYDGVGRDTFETSLSVTRPRGTVVLFGAASGPVPPFDLQRLAGLGSLSVIRPTLAHYIATREELMWRAGDVLAGVADGSLTVHIHERIALDEAARAHRELESRRTAGKVLLVPAQQ